MLGSFSVGLAVAASGLPFYTQGPFDPEIPTPEQILGYSIGYKHTVYADQERVTKAIFNAAPSRMKMIEYGKSTEGRVLRTYAISSPSNMARIDAIQADLGRLANPKPGDDLGAIKKRTPVLIWVNQCIHGDETASFESAMQLIYTLAASRNGEITQMLENAVVMINPVYNPDGHERYVVAYNSIPQGNPEEGSYDTAVPSAFMGRANHYRFDMNRDRISMSQQETRAEVALFQQWNPQVYVDQHGQVETYFFPPAQQSVNVNVDRERYEYWTQIFGRATGKEFDKQGWTYFIRDQYDLYNVCYLDSQTSLMGAIGMTHETDGGRLMSERRSDGTLLTMLDGAKKHYVAALAVIKSAADRRQELLISFVKFKENAVSGKHAGKFKRVVLSSEDPRELKRLETHLNRVGVKSFYAAKNWTQTKSHDYWSINKGKQEFAAGSLVVEMNQAQGPLAKSLLEPGSDFEPEFIQRQANLAKAIKENRKDSILSDFEFYDGTAWALPFAYNLQASWCEDQPRVEQAQYQRIVSNDVQSPVGYFVRYSDQSDIIFAAKALQSGLKVSLNPKAFSVGGTKVPAGSFVVLAARNEDGYDDKLRKMANDSEVQISPLTTSFPDEGRYGPGNEAMIQLKKPTIGIVFGSPGTLSGGALWYLMEKEFGLSFQSLTVSGLNQNLSRFTSIVIPGGVSVSSESGPISTWVRAGGTVIALDNPGWAIGEKGFVKLLETSTEFGLPGSLYRANLDPSSGLSYGYPLNGTEPINIAVPIDGRTFFKDDKSISTVELSPVKAVKKLLSGWEFEGTDRELEGISWMHEVNAGRGKAILFTNDPTSRAQWPGLYKLLLNSMIIAPSL